MRANAALLTLCMILGGCAASRAPVPVKAPTDSPAYRAAVADCYAATASRRAAAARGYLTASPVSGTQTQRQIMANCLSMKGYPVNEFNTPKPPRNGTPKS